MVASTEMAAASLGRLFKGSDALLGTSWVDSVNSGWSTDSHHHLIVSEGTVCASKTRNMYGHFRMATQIQRTEGTYYSKDPTASLIVANAALNVAGMNVTNHLHQLQTNDIGGILLLTHIPAS
jgi:hypothetical protein